MNEAEVVVLFSLDICYDVIKNYRDTSRFQLLNYRFVGTVITINSHKTSLLFESHCESFQAVKAHFVIIIPFPVTMHWVCGSDVKIITALTFVYLKTIIFSLTSAGIYNQT